MGAGVGAGVGAGAGAGGGGIDDVTCSTFADDVCVQLTPETHFIVTDDGHPLHTHVVPGFCGHHIVVDWQSLNPDAAHVNVNDCESLAFTVPC